MSSGLSEAMVWCIDYKEGEKASTATLLPLQATGFQSPSEKASILFTRPSGCLLLCWDRGLDCLLGVAALMGWYRVTQKAVVALLACRN